ncbi:MAG TPA: GTP-binding protein, partial [Planctomycetaceae bacterium]|nr:GTP-binding protein [Planctomycetaceae bacterium]
MPASATLDRPHKVFPHSHKLGHAPAVEAPRRREDIRNIAIIAHVDHGKTTLVDALLRQSGQFRESQLLQECILDSNDLERERGITILAKNIALNYKGVKINIMDTPGHADFGGEVERVLGMADGAIILVDAFEGPKPQTRFVTKKALERKLKPLVVVNKIDRVDCRPQEVLSEVFDLFVELGADDETLDFPFVFASGREGYATDDPKVRTFDVQALLDKVLEFIPGPIVDHDSPLQMMVTTLEWSEYVGRIATGRIISGNVVKGQKICVMKADGTNLPGEVVAVNLFDKLGRVDVETAEAGDIVALIGLPNPEIGETVADRFTPRALPRITVDEPTLSMLFTINDSPLAGKDGGKFLTSRHIRERLDRELEHNVALRVEEAGSKEKFIVSGRGILHLSVLIETMRREGYELSVGKPQVIIKTTDGKKCEPFETLTIDVPSESVGSVIEPICARRGQMLE